MTVGTVRTCGFIALLACATSCAVGEADDVDAIAAVAMEVVYGEDDRRDVYEVAGLFHTRAVESSAALMSWGNLRSFPDGMRVVGQSLREAERLCADQRFLDQPVAASCSATLVAPDLVLTAGHCVTTFEACQHSAIVFNYRMGGPDWVRSLSEDDVYGCVEIVARSLPDSSSLDFAFLRLDRPVAPHLLPAPVRASREPLERGSSVTMIGHPTGLPTKITGGGVVRDESLRSGNLFLTNLDAFAGNSGSGVYDAAGRLAGVLVWGDRDYTERSDEQCREVHRLPQSAAGEGVVYAIRAVELLCTGSPHVSSLCESFCFDEDCAQGRTDGLCGLGGCTPPISWRCEPEAYGSGGPCDCECGAVDPDCSLPSRPVVGCQSGMICGADARCEEDDRKSRSAFMRGCQAGAGAESGFGLALVIAILSRFRRSRRRDLHPEM